MIGIALKMLYGAPARAFSMFFGMTFAAFLMAQQSGIFWGVMTWTYAPMRVVQSRLWITAPHVEQVNDYDPMRQIDVQRVASVEGVAWAAPAFSSHSYARMPDGSHRAIQLMGVDDATFAGAPWQEVQEGIESLRHPDGVWVDDYGLERLAPEGAPPLKLGDSFEINERRAVITGVFPARRAFSGAPFVLTTFQRAATYSLPQRRLVSFILAEPQIPGEAARVARRIAHETGLRAYTDEELVNSTLSWWMRKTGVPGSFLTTVILSVIFGLTVNGLTFSSFVAQNRVFYAALSAMGTTARQLCAMLMAQSLSLCFISSGAGVLGALIFGMVVEGRGVPPFSMPWQIVAGVFLIQLLVGLFGPLKSLQALTRIHPASVFRS